MCSQELARAWRDERPRVSQSAEDDPRPAAARRRGAGRAGARARAGGGPRRGRRRRRSVRAGVRPAARRLRRRAEVPAARRSCCSCCDAYALTRRTRAREMALETLRAMAMGGMRDHVGGGFHRYSVDAEWRVPHFEKMLYDQAQLVLALSRSGAGQRRSVLRRRRRGHARLRRARSDRRRTAAFYSAEDADSAMPGPEDAGASDAARSAKAPSTSGPPPRSIALLGDDAAVVAPAVRRRGRRQRARPIRRASSAGRTSCTSRSRLKTSPRESGRPVRRGHGACSARARAAAVRRRERRGRGRISTTRSHRLERPDDRGVRARGARARRQSAPRRVARARPSAPPTFAPRRTCGARRRACSAGIATARRRSTASARTTRAWPGACSSCSRRPATSRWLDWALELTRRQTRRCSSTSATAAGSARPATTRRCCCG